MAVSAVAAVVGSVAAETVGVYVAGSLLASTTISLGTSLLVGQAVGALAGAVVGGVVTSAFAGGGGGASAVGSQQAQGMLINAASSISPLPVIYGSRRVGGGYVMPPSVSGANNEYLHLVIALCEGQVSAINTVYLDDVPTTDARFADLVTVEKFLGTDTQAASPLLMAAMPDKWTAAHQGKGVAYLHVQIRYDANAFHSIPTVTCDLDGRVLYDTRTGLTAFSNNPALCERDYLTNPRYGRGIASTLIDDATFSAAANHCDEMVAIPGGTQKRYTCDGSINVDDTVYANTQRLLSSCRGMLIFSGGKYKLMIDKQETPSSFTFSEDNITGAWEITRPGKREIVNKVSASFFNPANSWQPDIAIADGTAYRAQDNGLLLERKIDLPYTADAYRAEHLAQLELKCTRFGTVARFNAFQEGLRCEVGDVVKITHPTPGWVNKPFRVMTIDILDFDDVSITVREYDDSAYTLDALSAITTAPQTTLPDPFTVGAPSALAVAVENITQPDGTIIPRLVASWTAATDPFVVGYEVAVREDDGPWDTSTSTSTRWVIPASVSGRSYDVRVRAINSMGIRGAWLALDNTISTAPIIAPAAPTATVTGQMFAVRVEWAFGDARQDIRGTEVWWSATNDRAAAVRLTLEPFPAMSYQHVALAPGQTCYYWLRVADTYGNLSGWYPDSATAGLYAMPDADPSALLTQLQDAIGMPQLAAELSAPIDMIPGHQANLRALGAAADRAAEAALAAVLKMASIGTKVDAGISIDPATGEVRLHGIEEYRGATDARLSSAEVRLSGTEASISLKASVDYVNEAITLAVIDPSQVADLSNLYARMTSAELSIDGAEAAVALKAAQTVVDGINGRLTTAEGEVNVLQDQILLKASTSEVDAIDARLNTAETALSTIDGAVITQAVTSVRQLQREADTAAEAQLRALLFADRNIADLATVVAGAKNELYAHTNAGLVAEAGQRLALAAQVAANDAALTVEEIVRAAADSAAASSIATLLARLNTGDYAAVKLLAEATATALGIVLAKYAIKVDANGRVAGIELMSDGTVSAVAILADKFLVYRQDGTGTPVQVFTLGTVNGMTALALAGDLIADGTIVARHLSVASLSAITADLGVVTAGLLTNSLGSTFFDLEATGSQVVFQVGSAVTITADGIAHFDNVVISRNLQVATGSASALAGTYSVTPAEGWKKLKTVTVDTGYSAGSWLSATDQTLQALAGLIRGGGSSVTATYYTSAGTFIANWSVVVSRLYVKSRWSTTATVHLELELWAEVDGDIFQLAFTAPTWNLFRVT
jgi:hypothetical protein